MINHKRFKINKFKKNILCKRNQIVLQIITNLYQLAVLIKEIIKII